MSDVKRRTHYNFSVGDAVTKLHTDDLARLASAQVDLATAALEVADRAMALARLVAAKELLTELRQRGEQLRLRM